MIKDFEVEESNDNSILKPEVEIKVEENENLVSELYVKYVKDEDNHDESDLDYHPSDNNDDDRFDDNGSDSNMEFSGKENVKFIKKRRKKKKTQTPEEKVKATKIKNKIERLMSDKKFSCKECNRTFISNYHLTKHTNGVHTTISCSECKLEFSRKKDLKMHMKDLHPLTLNKFVCQVSTLFKLIPEVSP